MKQKKQKTGTLRARLVEIITQCLPKEISDQYLSYLIDHPEKLKELLEPLADKPRVEPFVHDMGKGGWKLSKDRIPVLARPGDVERLEVVELKTVRREGLGDALLPPIDGEMVRFAEERGADLSQHDAELITKHQSLFKVEPKGVFLFPGTLWEDGEREEHLPVLVVAEGGQEWQLGFAELRGEWYPGHHRLLRLSRKI